MGTLDQRSWSIDGDIVESDFTNQKVTVRTSHGETFTDVPVASQSISSKDKTGIHTFPRKGDRCWLTRDVDKWYVSSFGAAYDPSGKFAAKRPPLFRAGGTSIHADLSGLDVLPAFTSSNGVKLYATEKLGVTVESASSVVPAGSSSGSVTFSSAGRDLDGAAIARTLFSCGDCSESMSDLRDPTRIPVVTSVDVGAIIIDLSQSSMPDVTIQIFGLNFDKLVDDTKPAVTDKVKLTIPGFPANLARVTAVTITTAAPFSGIFAIAITRTSATPDGVYDIELENPTTGECMRIVAGLCINSFTPTSSHRTLFNVPEGLSIGFAQQPANINAFGAVFAVRRDIAGVLLQELQSGNATVDNSKYVGVSGPFTDLMALFDDAGVQQDNGFLNSLRFDTLTLAEIDGNPTPNLKFTIDGVADTQPAADAITSRLTAASARSFVFPGDAARRNLGIEVDNFQSTDKFRIEVYLETAATPPDYSLPPLIFNMEPSPIEAPRTQIVAINGENIRIGTDFTLVQSTRLQNPGTSNESLVPLFGSFPQLSLGKDTRANPQTIIFSNSGGESLTGKASIYRVSDKLIGIKLEITAISPGLYGEYNLVLQHARHSPASGTHVLYIRPRSSTGVNGNANDGPSTTNVYMQKVLSKGSDGTEKELFRYAVDEAGRLDITASGGIFFGGSSADVTGSLIGQVASTTAEASLVSQVGDTSLVAMDGNILIAALRANPTDKSKGDVHIHADGCVSIGHASPIVNVGRRANRAQFGTQAVVAQFGGTGGVVTKKFPDSFKVLPLPDDGAAVVKVKPYTVLGPMLVPDESHAYVGQVSVLEPGNGGPLTGLSSTFFTLRHRASSTAGKILEGRINWIFVPDGRGSGTDTDPYTGTWHIPLA